MKKLFRRLSPFLWTIALLLTARQVEAAITIYTVTVNTSSIAGTSGVIDFTFNPGPCAPNCSQPATAMISNFTGGTLGAVDPDAFASGNETGTLSSTVTLVNSAADNEYDQGFTFGSSFSFQLTLTGPALDNPNGTSSSGSTFALTLYNSPLPPTAVLLTNNPAGPVFEVNVNLNGTTTGIASPNATGGPTVVTFGSPQSSDVPFQVSYATNFSAGESYINIINDGANGAPALGPGFGPQAGNICVNLYAFDPGEEEVACCSCLVTPNQVASLGVSKDLLAKTETGVTPSSVTIKLVATLAGANCTNSAAGEGALVNGMVAYGTTPQPVAKGVYEQVEHSFTPSSLSADEYASITGRCASILGNASGYGQCTSCTPGAQGAAKQ
jgi:hypothetical protein